MTSELRIVWFLSTFVLHLPLSCSLEVSIKKEGWVGGGHRFVKVMAGTGDEPTLKVSGKTLIVSIGSGLPNTMSKEL